ncbi:Sensor protein KdpD [Delftia tsuruhatensis]|uniref:sensor histidine kinase n=1 Tax=Delftia tsuruhatensis TaxID=180282 RepID=UPI001E6B7D7B|nr:sensor histidine kinase KdpD [Delftia tsuruhatensis]CAB5692338.1 Sensor protein KdpD [Delftia tsuruhatensis]CAC9676764.1 Sensor protein KdpD [Delftia tsuruhatensis]
MPIPATSEPPVPGAARPDPDALVARLRQEQEQALRGKLRIYFGSNAGVGKTYAMLAAAQRERHAGREVLVGLVETHGRKETAQQLHGLEQLPLRELPHQGRVLREFDLDAALARHPRVLLLDELAHSNAPGSRHPKRWQDVQELLDAGIDVWTTLNVQHLESLNDVVGGIVGITVRETVPDQVFDDADEVIIVDISPDELLRRLKDGKVYMLEQAERASRNFFRRGNLLALRELALRRTADRVDEDMRDYRRERSIGAVWPARERLLVAVAGSPGDAALVRQVARMARRLDADWMVVYVDAPERQHRPRSAQAAVLRTLALAARLGAETATLPGNDVAEALVAFARERNASRLVLAQSPRPLWSPWRWWSRSMPDRIARLHPDIDVLVLSGGLRPGQGAVADEPAPPARPRPWPWKGYAGVTLACLAATLLAEQLLRIFDPANVVMLFLLIVVLSSLRWGRGPGAWAALLSVLCFDYFFVPPRGSFHVNDTQYLFTFVLMLGVALVCGQLMARLRHEARVAAERERRAGALARLARDLSGALTQEQVADIALRTVSGVFEAQAGLLLPDDSERLRRVEGSACAMDESIARWCMDHGQPAGQGTDTLAAAPARYVPLAAPVRMRGVLVLQLRQPRRLEVPEEQRLLDACASQVALALERQHFVAVAQQTQVAMEGERMRNTLLSAVSHDLRTPLTTILGAAEAARRHVPPGDAADMLEQVRTQAQAMQRLVENLLDMARLQQGGVHLQREWLPLDEIVGSALRQMRARLQRHPVSTDLPADLPLLHVDPVLMERVLVNLLDNAAKYTPPGTPLAISAREVDGELQVQVRDAGPGLPAHLPAQALFEPFTRGTAESTVSGIGLGLSLVRSIVQAHGGRIEAAAAQPGPGTVITLHLPVPEQPELD